jgi:hypothetical protein
MQFAVLGARKLILITESLYANAYWRKLKERLKADGNESATNCPI